MGNSGCHATQRRHFIHLRGQVIELGLLIFHQLNPFDNAGALLGNRYNKIQFVIGKIALLGKIYPNQSSHLIPDSQGHIDNHADAFIPCFLRVFHSRGVPDVWNDFNFVKFRRIGQQFIGTHRTLAEIMLSQPPCGPYIEPVRFFVKNSETSAFGVQDVGGFGYDDIQHFLKTDAGVHRTDDVSENMEIVFKFR
jgi:hypothetical protein